MRLNHYFGILSSILFFTVGTGFGFTALEKDVIPPDEKSFLALIESTPVEKKNTYAFELKLQKVELDSGVYQTLDARIIAYIPKQNLEGRIFPGNSIQFSSSISTSARALYPNQFDYTEYLRNIGISGTTYIPNTAYHFVETDEFSLKAKLNATRARLLQTLREDSIPIKEYGVISALLVGDRSYLDPQLRNEFADAGAVHILAVSGLHVGIIYLLFLSILNFLLQDRYALVKFLLILLILWSYAALTGFSPSVLRAATMFSFIALGKFHKRYGNIYNMIAASALFLLALNPLLITQIGFQLSYIAVIGIVYFHPKFYALIAVENKYIAKLWSLICVSVAAQLATFPLSIYYFHQFPTLFLVTNILVIPLASIILHAGIAWVFFLWVPHVSELLQWITVEATWLLNTFVELINTMPFSKVDSLYLSSLSVLLMYLIIVLISAFLTKPNTMILRLLGLAIISISALFIHRKLKIILQDDIFIPTLNEGPLVIRLIQDEIFVFAEDSAEFAAVWERELYPYFLTRGIRSSEGVRFADVGNYNAVLRVRKSNAPSDKQHVIWNPGKEEVLTYSNNSMKRVETTTPLLHFGSAELTRFSNE